MSDLSTHRRFTASEIRAVAHPIRLRLLELLREGPATATMLARRLGESSGATSYHLRQLGRYGLIDEDRERGVGRERWWKRREQMLQLDVVSDDAEHVAAFTALRATLLERDEEAVQALARNEVLLRDRPENLWLGSWRVVATPDEIKALVDLVLEHVDALRRSPEDTPEGAKAIHVTFRSIQLE